MSFSVSNSRAGRQLFNANWVAGIRVPPIAPTNGQALTYNSTSGALQFSTVGGLDTLGQDVYTVGEGCEYSTITEALEAAYDDGHTSGFPSAVILIMPGSYTEDLDFTPVAVTVMALSFLTVVITGSHTFDGISKFSNIVFNTSNLATFNCTGDSELTLESCQIELTGNTEFIHSEAVELHLTCINVGISGTVTAPVIESTGTVSINMENCDITGEIDRILEINTTGGDGCIFENCDFYTQSAANQPNIVCASDTNIRFKNCYLGAAQPPIISPITGSFITLSGTHTTTFSNCVLDGYRGAAMIDSTGGSIEFTDTQVNNYDGTNSKCLQTSNTYVAGNNSFFKTSGTSSIWCLDLQGTSTAELRHCSVFCEGTTVNSGALRFLNTSSGQAYFTIFRSYSGASAAVAVASSFSYGQCLFMGKSTYSGSAPSENTSTTLTP